MNLHEFLEEIRKHKRLNTLPYEMIGDSFVVQVYRKELENRKHDVILVTIKMLGELYTQLEEIRCKYIDVFVSINEKGKRDSYVYRFPFSDLLHLLQHLDELANLDGLIDSSENVFNLIENFRSSISFNENEITQKELLNALRSEQIESSYNNSTLLMRRNAEFRNLKIENTHLNDELKSVSSQVDDILNIFNLSPEIQKMFEQLRIIDKKIQSDKLKKDKDTFE